MSVPERDERDLIDRRPDLAPAVERLGVAIARLMARRWHNFQSAAAAEPEPAAPTEPKRRKARPKPSRLAKWEASWQAEQGDEARS